MSEQIGIGQLGYGSIGKVHTLAYRSIPFYYPGALPEIRSVAVCTTNAQSAAKAAREGGFARAYTSVDELIADPDVTVIDCSLPNFAHKSAIRAALDAGKHIYCEKPLCVDMDEAREIAAAAEHSRAHVGMTFDYRFIPAIARAKQLIKEGALGEIYNFQFNYLHTGYQDDSRPLSWRTRKELSGGGALFDLGSHVIDLARYLIADFAQVFATTRTFVGSRPIGPGSQEKGPVTVDDAVWMQARLADGSMGTIEVSRFATGSLDDLTMRIEGKRGALKFDLMDANWLYFYNAARTDAAAGAGWTRLETAASFPGAQIPPARSILGWTRMHAENQYRFLRSIAAGSEPEPGLADGYAAQLVMESAYESAASGSWVPIPRV
ncbi:MAG TPA: Gfo/Idh/MocA family oxidoreductase [Spirochaetia bacterium]|nr:Gfo/Idh/MocA family oxidoreductase [Spirochaetia bacterium]